MKKTIVLIFAFVMHAVMVEAQSLESVIRSIEENNVSLKIMATDNLATAYELRDANKLSGLSVEYSPFFSKGVSGVATSELIVSQQFDFPSLYGLRRRQVDSEVSLLDNRREAERKEIVLQAALLYCDIVKQNKLITLMKQRKRNADDILALYTKRLNAGDATALDVNKAKMELMTVTTLLVQAENERMELLKDLQVLNGNNAMEISSEDYPEFAEVVDFNSYVAVAKASDADIMTAKADIKAAEMQAAVGKLAWLPQITMGYRRNTEVNESFNGFMIGMALPLYSASSKVKAAAKRKESASMQMDALLLQKEVEIRNDYDKIKNIKRIIESVDTSVLMQTLDLLDKALHHGEITSLTYNTEKGEIYDKLEEQIDLRCQYVRLLIQLHKHEL